MNVERKSMKNARQMLELCACDITRRACPPESSKLNDAHLKEWAHAIEEEYNKPIESKHEYSVEIQTLPRMMFKACLACPSFGGIWKYGVEKRNNSLYMGLFRIEDEMARQRVLIPLEAVMSLSSGIAFHEGSFDNLLKVYAEDLERLCIAASLLENGSTLINAKSVDERLVSLILSRVSSRGLEDKAKLSVYTCKLIQECPTFKKWLDS